MTTVKWVHGGGYELPQRWAFKKDIPKHLQWQGIRVQFRFETVWIVRNERKEVLMPQGGWMPTFDFYLHTPGHVIGPCDASIANNYDWWQEWNNACMNLRAEQLKTLPTLLS